MIPSTASSHAPCQITQRAVANVEQAMRHMRASRNFYPQQAKALLLTFHPIPNNANATSMSPSPTPTELSLNAEQPVFRALKRRMRKSKEIIEAMFSDSAEAGNLVKMLKKGSWTKAENDRTPHARVMHDSCTH